MKVVYANGVVLEHPLPARPLPPLDSGAPINNMFRLVETTARIRPGWTITVVSAAASSQMPLLRRHSSAVRARYVWARLPDRLRAFSGWMFHRAPLSRAFLLRTVRCQSLQGWLYMRELRRVYEAERPDVVVLDCGQQFIPAALRFVPADILACFCRGEMGDSRRWLHLPGWILTTNEPLGEWLRTANPRIQRIVTVSNSLGPEFLTCRSRGPWNPAAPHSVLFVGRIASVKGVETLIRAFPLVLKELPRTKLVLIGSQWEQTSPRPPEPGPFERAMRRLAQELIPPHAVEWRGWVSGSALAEAYRDASVCAFPSTWVEGFGMVALEAMACGVPVIASRRPGFEYLLGEGRGLLLDDPRDPCELASKILWVLRNPVAAHEMAESGKRFARTFTPERSAEEFAAAIERIRAGASASPPFVSTGPTSREGVSSL